MREDDGGVEAAKAGGDFEDVVDFSVARGCDEVEVGVFGRLEVGDGGDGLRLEDVGGESGFEEAGGAEGVADEAFDGGDGGASLQVGKSGLKGDGFHRVVVAGAGAVGEDDVDVVRLELGHGKGLAD